MAGIEISFQGKDRGQSSQLARELLAELRGEGVPDGALAVARERTDTMDIWGSIINLAPEILALSAVVIDAAVIARGIYDLCFREHTGLRIKTPTAVLEFAPGEIDIEKLRTVLQEAISAGGKQ